MEKIKLAEVMTDDLVKSVLVNDFGYEDNLVIRRSITEDGVLEYRAYDKKMYRGERVTRMLPLGYEGYVTCLKVALNRLGYETISIKPKIHKGILRFEVICDIVKHDKRNDKGRSPHGLRLRRKDS